MSKYYQPDRNLNTNYNHDYDSGYSQQKREYQDLYNPYKSIWNNAIKGKPAAPAFEGPERKSKYESLYHPASGTGTSGSVYYRSHPRDAGNTPYSSNQNPEEVFDSGYNVTRKNTYKNRTSGYGPRD